MVNEHEQLTAGNSNRVALKLPPWIPSDPDMWLTLVDRTFDLANITCEDTKFSYVATDLDQSVIMEVRDIVMNPPASEPYKAITKALVNRLSVSQELKTRRLLEKEEMGDSKPSQFLRRLRALAGAAVSDDLLRTLWSGRLPQSVQAIIASQKNSKLDDVAELADAVMASIAPKASLVYVRVPIRVSVRGPGREAAAKETIVCAGIIASTPRKLTDARNHVHTVPRNRETKRAVVNGGRRQLPYVTPMFITDTRRSTHRTVTLRTTRRSSPNEKKQQLLAGSQNQRLQHQVQYARDPADVYAFRTVTKPASFYNCLLETGFGEPTWSAADC
ncbi:hypothetical protein NQ318_010756 [Aromia moschata]|uniref:DUF7041 domain-containing protein n=1 Tax=Aromia moschata TaxID=1265417 RepID=A0AAV8YXU0_9CUCU|nr:hypothetical protein NQ318_010756 [Aromia moschata]